MIIDKLSISVVKKCLIVTVVIYETINKDIKIETNLRLLFLLLPLTHFSCLSKLLFPLLFFLLSNLTIQIFYFTLVTKNTL